MKCNYCDYNVSEECKCCPNCGENPKTTKKNPIKGQVKNKEEKEKNYNTKFTKEALCISWSIIGFFIPIIGIILFCIWIKSKPKEAKAAGIGVLIRMSLYILYYIIQGLSQFL